MKKSHFTNLTVYWTIITIIGGLFIWNLYAFINSGLFIGLLPMVIQAVLLVLIFTKNQFAKIGIKIWAILFLAIAYGLKFIGRLIQDLVENFSNIDPTYYLIAVIGIILGISITYYINRTVDIIEVEK